MSSLFPPHPVDFWLKRWLGGVVCPLTLTGYAVYSLVTEHGYAVCLYGRYGVRACFVDVTGFNAALMAVAWMGLALLLFSNCYAPYSGKCAIFDKYGEVTGLLLIGAGVCWCSWRLLIGA